jgi:DNA polymerase-3 subunit delta'
VIDLPWLQGAAAQLLRAQAAGRLPHALLLHESPGVGGTQFATWVAQLVLCAGDTPACGRCSACTRVARGEHPDLLLVPPDPESKLGQIIVDQVRDIGARLALSSYEGRGSCAVFLPADAMNRAAANALLKTLEEPRAGAHLVLLTSTPALLPATVRSRCQTLRLPAPTREQALAWLDKQQGPIGADWSAVLDVLGIAPLEALASNPAQLKALRDDTLRVLSDARQGTLDVIRVADQWARDELPLRLRCIENCLTTRLLAMRAGTHLSAGSLDINIGAALGLLDDVRELRRQLGTSLNKPLALERQLWRLNAAAGARH